MLKTLRGEIWETYMEWFPATVGIKPGTAGCWYIDGREVNMRVDGNLHRLYMQVNTVGHVNPDKPKALDETTVKGLTRDYQLGLWGNDFADLGLKRGMVMKSVLDELYDGEIRPCELQNTMEMQELIGIIADCNEKLEETLTEEQVALLEQFVDVCAELKMAEEREVFKRAFRLGVRMGIEVILVLENK